METAIVLFTRDLRVRDNPALAIACTRARQVVPLFVVDPALTVPPNRARFLAESVSVLRSELRKRGGDLVIRTGEPVAEVIRLAKRTGAQAVFVAADVSRYAARRQQRLAAECDRHRLALEITPGHAVVPAGDAVLASLARRRLAAALPGPGGGPCPRGHQAGRPAWPGRALFPPPGAGRRAGGQGTGQGLAGRPAWPLRPRQGRAGGRPDIPAERLPQVRLRLTARACAVRAAAPGRRGVLQAAGLA